MKTLVITSAFHNTTCELVNDFNLTVCYNVVDISSHNAVSLDSLVDMVEKCGVVNIHKVFNVEIFLSLFNTVLSKCCGLSFFVNNIVAVVC